jgi:hypothetical protein
MRKISQPVKDKLLQEKDICALKDSNCSGRITWEHCLTFGGKQIDEAWAIIKICEYHHSVNKFQDIGGLNKEKNIWCALNKATDQELLKYSKCIDYIALRERLNKKYGTYKN